MIGIPFNGSKRNWVKRVEEIVRNGGYDKTLEPFGGSCIISANLANDGIIPYENAFINDYDRLFDIYGEFLDVKDYVVSECLKRGLRPVKCDKIGHYQLDENGEKIRLEGTSLNDSDRKILQGVMAGVDKKWWRLLSNGTNFTFAFVPTHRNIRLEDFILFHRHLGTDLQRAYLKVIEGMPRDSMDWRDFLEKHRDAFGPRTLIIVDPPYHNTVQVQYKGTVDEEGSVGLLDALKGTGCDFLFFGYGPEWLEGWLESNGLAGEFEFRRVSTWVKGSKFHEYMCYVRVAK